MSVRRNICKGNEQGDKKLIAAVNKHIIQYIYVKLKGGWWG